MKVELSQLGAQVKLSQVVSKV